MIDAGLATARRNAEHARERLLGDAHLLQARLAPAALAAEAKLVARTKVDEAVEIVRSKADDAVEAARERPAIPAVAAAGILAFLFRKPAYRAVRRLFGRDRAVPTDGDES